MPEKPDERDKVKMTFTVNGTYIIDDANVSVLEDDVNGIYRCFVIVDQTILADVLSSAISADAADLTVSVRIDDGVLDHQKDYTQDEVNMHITEAEVSCKIRNYRMGFGFGRLNLKMLSDLI